MNNGTFVEISRYTLGRITLMQILAAVASQLLAGAFFKMNSRTPPQIHSNLLPQYSLVHFSEQFWLTATVRSS